MKNFIIVLLAFLPALCLAQKSPKLTLTVKGVSFEMVFVEGGTFQMGATSEQGSDADHDEKPVHPVTLNDFYIGETEVTQGLWKAVMGKNLSSFQRGDNYPVECVTWEDCQVFIKKLNKKTGKTFRLPTEAEWEYAARGGKESKGYKYSGSDDLKTVAWYNENSDYTTYPVRKKSPNELGLYDMSGNVYEWCYDTYDEDYYSKIDINNALVNPVIDTPESYRVLRGGSWYFEARRCRVSDRCGDDYIVRYEFLGLRLVLVP
jgi:formylglycine-generating enzyme required for sulfatase activity